jgi:hypothetical protein
MSMRCLDTDARCIDTNGKCDSTATGFKTMLYREREKGRVSVNDSMGKGANKDNVKGRRKGLVRYIGSAITNGNEERCRCIGIGKPTNDSSIPAHG